MQVRSEWPSVATGARIVPLTESYDPDSESNCRTIRCFFLLVSALDFLSRLLDVSRPALTLTVSPQIAFRAPEYLFRQVQKVAKQRGITLSSFYREAVVNHLAQHFAAEGEDSQVDA